MSAIHSWLWRSKENLDSPFHTVVLVFLVATLSYLSMVLGSGMSIPPHNVSPLWPTNAVVLVVLLAVPRRLWPILITTAYSVVGFLHVLRAPITVSLWLTLGNAVEVIVAAFGVRYFFKSVPRLNSTKSLAQYSLIAAGLAPCAGAFIGALAARPGSYYWLHWKMWFLSDGLALFTLPPAVWGLVHLVSSLGRKSRLYYLELVTLTAVLILFGYATLVASGRSSPQALLYPLVPLLLWSAFRFGSGGTSISVLVVSVLSIWGAVHGRGPFTEQGPIDSVLSLQLFLLFTASPFMVLAVLVEQHKQDEQALRESENRLRVAAEVGRMYAWEWDPSTDSVLRSADCVSILGLAAAAPEGSAKDYFTSIQPDDRAHLWSLVNALTPAAPVYRTQYRRFHPGGALQWLEESGCATFDGNGRMVRLVGMTADITDRKQVEHKLRDSQDQLAGIVGSAMDAIIAIDEEQRVVLFNTAAEKMFGCAQGEAVGTAIDRFIPQRFRSVHGAHVRRFGESGVTARTMGTLGALWAVRMNGQEFPIEASISHLESGGRKLFTVIVRDITERRQAEDAVRESEERFRLVANTAPVMIWTAGPDKLCNYFNQPWLDFTGRSIEAELGNGWAEMVHPEDFQRCLDTYQGAFDRREPFQMQYRLRRHDGEYRWLLDIGVPRLNLDGSFAGYIGSCIDITDRKLAEEAMADMGRRLIEAHEEERTRIARELHDDINQRLALAVIELEQWGQEHSKSGVEIHERIVHVKQRLSDLGKDVQALSHRLHSSKLDYLGLTVAATSFCRELSEQQKVEIDFTHEGMPSRAPKEISICLFRILQEALQNAVKHSGVRHFRVKLEGTSAEIQLTISDHGVGFDQRHALSGRGLGLISMRERLQLVMGDLTIKSGPGRGTTISARAPLAAEQHRTRNGRMKGEDEPSNEDS
jgi:PAS domain S-box-containing protein